MEVYDDYYEEFSGYEDEVYVDKEDCNEYVKNTYRFCSDHKRSLKSSLLLRFFNLPTKDSVIELINEVREK